MHINLDSCDTTVLELGCSLENLNMFQDPSRSYDLGLRKAWVFSGCLLTVGSRYTVLAYISGIGAHLDGIVETAT